MVFVYVIYKIFLAKWHFYGIQEACASEAMSYLTNRRQ